MNQTDHKTAATTLISTMTDQTEGLSLQGQVFLIFGRTSALLEHMEVAELSSGLDDAANQLVKAELLLISKFERAANHVALALQALCGPGSLVVEEVAALWAHVL